MTGRVTGICICHRMGPVRSHAIGWHRWENRDGVRPGPRDPSLYPRDFVSLGPGRKYPVTDLLWVQITQSLSKSFLIFSRFHLSHYCYKTPSSKFSFELDTELVASDPSNMQHDFPEKLKAKCHSFNDKDHLTKLNLERENLCSFWFLKINKF